jgi:hypothetical protein
VAPPRFILVISAYLEVLGCLLGSFAAQKSAQSAKIAVLSPLFGVLDSKK